MACQRSKAPCKGRSPFLKSSISDKGGKEKKEVKEGRGAGSQI